MNGENQQERILTAEYLAGFIDGEGCFSVSVHPNPNAKFGWIIDPDFTINQHKQSHEFLKSIQKFLGCGKIYSKSPGKSNVLTYTVYSRKTIFEKILPFLEKHPPLSNKYKDFLIFKEIILKMQNHEHSTIEGFHSIVKLAFKMNANGKQRAYKLKDVLRLSSETTRQTSAGKADEDIVRTQ
ncbi:MAG: homing endonuclease [Ignavibacteria bacterium]|nr:homing endonuclease [Ignavibacteria bacterium]